ncbi:MAG: PorT family protein, partial [Prevotella sp.]|nr:PorT family protein [Prevotella sp.]
MVKVLPFYLLTFIPFTVSAQVGEYRSDFAVGFNGGYSMSSIAYVPKVPQGQLGGITAGFSARYTCEKYFKSICAVVGEVNLTQMGWQEDILNANDEPVVLHT